MYDKDLKVAGPSVMDSNESFVMNGGGGELFASLM